MFKTICSIADVILLCAILFSLVEAAEGKAMPIYKETNLGYLARPAIKKDADGPIGKDIQDEIKSSNNEHGNAPKANAEDKVIEFIVSDVGH